MPSWEIASFKRHSGTLAHRRFWAHDPRKIPARAVSNFSDAYIREMRAPMQTDMNLFLEVLAGAFALAVILLRVGPGLKLIREEQRNPATRFGSKKWHWPALTAAVLLQLAYLALIFFTRTQP